LEEDSQQSEEEVDEAPRVPQASLAKQPPPEDSTSSVKRKRISNTTTSKMIHEVEGRVAREKQDGGFAFQIAQRHICPLGYKCPSGGSVCVNSKGHHLTIYPAYLTLWDEMISRDEATIDVLPEQLEKKLLDAARIDRDSEASKRQSKKRRSSSGGGSPNKEPDIIHTPAIVQAPIQPAIPSSANITIHDIVALLAMNNSARPHCTHQFPYPGYGQQLIEHPWVAPSVYAPFQQPVAITQPYPISYLRPSSPSKAQPYTVTAVPEARPISRSDAPSTPPNIYSSDKPISVQSSRAREPSSSPIRANIEERKLDAFFSYIIEQEPHRADAIEELQCLLVDDQKFSWKALTRELKGPNRGIDIFSAAGVPIGHVLLMDRYLDGFRKQWRENFEAAKQLSQLGG
jgi:hypothetical protein